MPWMILAGGLISVVVSGCGAAGPPGSVLVSLTAPSEGATVVVKNITVFGRVTPENATVLIGGNPVHLARGVFRKPMDLRAGENHIRIAATAPGLKSTRTTVAVDYQIRVGSGHPTSRSSSADSPFVKRANAVCAASDSRIGALPVIRSPAIALAQLPKLEAISVDEVKQLAAIAPPPAVAAKFNAVIANQNRVFALMTQLIADLKVGHRTQARALIPSASHLVRQSNSLLESMSLNVCAAIIVRFYN